MFNGIINSHDHVKGKIGIISVENRTLTQQTINTITLFFEEE